MIQMHRLQYRVWNVLLDRKEGRLYCTSVILAALIFVHKLQVGITLGKSNGLASVHE